MGEHAKKLANIAEVAVEEDRREANVSLAGPDSPVLPSPARAIQNDLELELAGRPDRFSMREVIGTLVVFCFAVWWALFMLVRSLV